MFYTLWNTIRTGGDTHNPEIILPDVPYPQIGKDTINPTYNT